MKGISKLLTLILLLIPNKVSALTGNISLNCSTTTAKANTNIVCNVTATSDEEINGFSANINLSSNLEFVNFETDSIWQGDGTGNKIGLYTSENKKGEFNLGKLTIKVKDNVFDTKETISLSNCIYSDKDFKKVNIDNAKVDIRIPSSNNKLSKLEVLPGIIDFNKDKLEYSLSVDSPSVNITAVKEDDKSTITGDLGNKSLKYGLNTLKVIVTSESGDKRTYTLNITRKDNRSTENRLSSLVVSGNKINFNENIYEYNLSVSYENTSVKISANLKDKTSSFVKGYEPGTKNLKEGNNKILLKVAAENGSIKTYTLNITRKEDPENTSNDNYLDNIEIENSKLEFNKERQEYKITVDYNTNNLDIKGIASSNKSRVEITGNENLQVGENTITIKVTSANGEVREYKIIVNKKDKEVILSSNNYLKLLEIDNYNIKFNKEKYSYKIKIKDEKELIINAISEDKNANITINGNKDLKNKSIITIKVTAENGDTKEYKINISKKLEINYLLITVIVETIIIIGVFAYFIIKNKRKNYYEKI